MSFDQSANLRKKSGRKIVTSFWQKITLLMFGCLLSLMLIEVSLRAGSLLMMRFQDYRNARSLARKNTCRVMCLGESTTRGQYPSFLEDRLNQLGAGITFSVIDKGVAGTNTFEMLDGLMFNLERYRPDIVITMMGVNDFQQYVSYKSFRPPSRPFFLSRLKTFTFSKFLWLRIRAKAQEVTSKLSHQGKDLPNVAGCVFSGRNAVLNNRESPDSLKDLSTGDLYMRRWLFENTGRPSPAEGLLKQAITLNPKNDHLYVALGWIYQKSRKFAQAIEMIEKACALNPRNPEAYEVLGWVYQDGGNFIKAEEAFKKASVFKPLTSSIHVALGWMYRKNGKLSEAEAAFNKAIALNQLNDRAYGACALLYEEMNRPEAAAAYRLKANELRLGHFYTITRNNYLRLKAVLAKKGILLVAVQYPMRSIEPLKRIFQGNESGIVFVDNEKIFRDAVRENGSNVYFRDMFAGDFGHCTDQGNKLLADNIARVIIEKAFNR